MTVTIRSPASRLDLRPRLVGALGQPDVVGPVVGEADDPAVVGRGAVDVAELELLEAEDAVAERAAQPVGGARPDPAQPDDDGVPVATLRVHRPAQPPDRWRERMSARRWTPTTVIASVIRPSRVIASASSNGTQRTSSVLGRLGCRRARSRPGRQEEHGGLVGDRVREVDPGELAPRRRPRRRSPRAARAAPRRARLAVGHAALGDLPRVGVERVAVLADEQHAVARRRRRGRPAARFAKWTTP